MARLDDAVSGPSRGWWIAIAVVVAIVVFRSIVPVLYEQADFDSDQATVGLMAKHLSELRTFPLFLYGENYMLGVQAWMAAPLFWIGGPSVAMLRLPEVAVGAAIAIAALLILKRRQVSPAFAVLAVLPLVATTPLIAAGLLETGGSAGEPLLYVLLLWAIRDRPLWFGALLCFGTLHREFTLAALPAIVVVQAIERAPWKPREWLRCAGGFAAVWIAVSLIKQQVNMFGPAGGEHVSSSLVDEMRVIGSWLSFRPDVYLARVVSVYTDGLPVFLGGERHRVFAYSVNSTLEAGATWAGWLIAATLTIAAGRLLWLARDREARPRFGRATVAVYLAVVAVVTSLAYGLNDGIDPDAVVVMRYVLLTMFLPVAALAAFVIVDRQRGWRIAAAFCAVLWAGANVWDNARLLQEYRTRPPASEFRQLADYLVGRGITYGRAQYWDANIVTFLSGERVILASTGKVRISAYQADVERHAAEAATILREPCEGGERIASWCVIRP